MNKRSVLMLFALGTAVLALAGCQRSEIDEPGPTGPSSVYLTFSLTATPNVLYATTTRPSAEIRGTLMEGQNPVRNAAVFFTVYAGPGTFQDYTRRVLVFTDSAGNASVTYIGPLKSEIGGDQDVLIRAQVETSSPNFIYKDTFVHVLRQD